MAVPLQEQVARLDVAMDDSLAVGCVQGLGRFHGQGYRARYGKVALVELLLQRLALQELRHQVVDAFGLPHVVDRDDVGVRHRREHAGLKPEAAHPAKGASVGRIFSATSRASLRSRAQ